MTSVAAVMDGVVSVSGTEEPEHVDRATYREWLAAYAGPTMRYSNLYYYDAFVDRWPRLSDWFAAPLEQRVFDVDNPTPGSNPHGGPSVIMPYLAYLSLVHGVRLDYDLLLARSFRSPFTGAARARSYGVDLPLFESHTQRLTQLGYSPAGAAQALKWGLGRLVLHRGDPNLITITEHDVAELRTSVIAFAERGTTDLIHDFRRRSPTPRSPLISANEARIHLLHQVTTTHLLLFTIGQVNTQPLRRSDTHSWHARLAPDWAPPAMAAVIERYLRFHLEANLGREQSIRHFRDALWRLVRWAVDHHPELTNFDQLTREHAEQFLAWLGTRTSAQTGAPLAVTTRRSVVTLLSRFAAETAAWEWQDAPSRVLFVRGDIPKLNKPLPRFIPEHELNALMAAITTLHDPYQRAALIVARWSGARRDEIRRLELDCLDTYPDGHPRLRIPVGKGYTERSIPLHPDAAAVLQTLIDEARRRDARGVHDASSGRPVRYVFSLRGKLLSNAFLFDLSLKAACTTAGLVDSAGRQTISAHRFRHTIGTQLAEGGARLQTIMAVLGHRTPNMSIIYAALSDPTIKQQYQDALDSSHSEELTLGGPAARTILDNELDPEAVSWLQSNFLKTELELGHCLRLPAEGPCECDLMLTCSKFLTSSDYAPRLRQRLKTEQQLINDAIERGWDREVERHRHTAKRLESLLGDMHCSLDGTPNL